MTTATCRVTFGSGASATAPYYVIELDEVLNVDADGKPKTTFAAGEIIWFLLHVQPGFFPALRYQTDGQVSAAGLAVRERLQEGALWTPEEQAVELTYYPFGELAIDWQGNQVALAPLAGRTLAAVEDPLTLMARADLRYPVQFHLFRFDPPAGMVLAEGEDYQIDALITLEPAA